MFDQQLRTGREDQSCNRLLEGGCRGDEIVIIPNNTEGECPSMHRQKTPQPRTSLQGLRDSLLCGAGGCRGELLWGE